MIIENSTDKLEILLSSTVTTRPIDFVVSYIDITTTGVTPTKRVGTVNGTTAVDVIPSPPSGSEYQMKYCNIFNDDSFSVTVTIRMNYNGTTRTVFKTRLTSQDYIQYTQKNGWSVYYKTGALRLDSGFNNDTDLRGNEFHQTTSTTANVSIPSGTTYLVYLGKSTGSYKNFLNLTTTLQTAVGVSWAETAIYRGDFKIGESCVVELVDWLDMTTTWQNSLNQYRWNTFLTKGKVVPGDDLWATVAISNTSTQLTMRNLTIVDDIGAGFVQNGGSFRPSLTQTLTGTVLTNITGFQSYWKGF